MPIYGYQCKACEHQFDALQKMSDDPLVDCPDCGAPELRKQLSAPKFRLKGKGWYETDFKTGDKRNLHGDAATKTDDAKKESKPDSNNNSKTDSKTDSVKKESKTKSAEA